MDVINISGMQFRMKPNVTVRHVLEVFRGFGKEGVIQRNGVVEFLDSPIESNSVFPYEFVGSTDLSEICKYRNGVEYVGTIPELNRIGNTQTAELLNIRPKINYNGANVLMSSASLFDQSSASINQPTALLVQQPSIIDRTTLLNQQVELLRQRDQELKFYNDGLIGNDMPIISNNKFYNLQSQTPFDFSPSVYLEPTFYQFVVLKENVNKFLKLKEIEVYNLNGQNIINKAGVLFDEMMHPEIMPLYRQFHKQTNTVRTSIPGGSILLLKFQSERNDSISKIVLRNSGTDLNLNQLLNGATLEVRKINEYSLDRESKCFTYLNSYPGDWINAIEIKAPADRLLQLSKIRVIDTLDQAVDVMGFDSSDLVATRKGLSAQQLLLQSRDVIGDYVQSAHEGGYIRLTLAKPMPIKALQLMGSLRGVKVTMERIHSYNCSGDVVQHFSI